jgi:hypothetical protein
MRASGSYESLIRGVSQQVPHDRAIGQHTAQVNMLSDPVNGLTRRHGSQLVAEKKLTSLSVAQFAAYAQDTNSWRTLEGSYNLNDYVVLYRTAARPAGASPLPLMIVYCKTTKTFLTLTRNASDPYLDQLEEGGISAACFIGRYLFMAGNTITSQGSVTPKWNTADNMAKSVVWIRGGAYGRTFTAVLTKTDGSLVNYSASTPPQTYPGTLDTSDILTSDPDYTKKVNDRVNAYNSAVNSWITSSTYQVQPANMAALVAPELVALGISATAMGSHIVLSGVRSISVNDGGDGSLLRSVGDEVDSVDKLSPLHYVGKVVKVRARSSDQAFYMQAISKTPSIASGVTEVTWVECAGEEYSVDQGLFFGTVDGGITTAYLASSPALLNAIFPSDHPQYAVSQAGDGFSAPIPYVGNRRITYLTSFQDRLLVGSGGVVVCSKIGDYLNFFRSTVLSVPADDPFEMKSQGPDDDVLRHSVLYDQSLVIFGDKRQYVISGKVALSPTNASMPVMSAYADAAICPPHVAGGLIFYAKNGERFASVNEIQPGRGLQNSPESFPASSQIDDYMLGAAIELTSNAEPSTLIVRTTGSRNSVYTFFYVDRPDGRKVDAWSRWDFDPALGLVIGMTPTTEGVHLYYLREGHDGVYVACDLCPMTVGLSDRPYLDSQRPVATVIAGTGSVRGTTPGPWMAAYDYTAGERQWLGSTLADSGALATTYPGVTGMVIGAPQVAYFEPTNPYMRDGNGSAILSGRLTITSMRIATADSAGFKAVVDVAGTQQTISFTGRVVGQPNVIGVEHISTNEHTVPIGRETRAYSLRLSARSWLPFTVTAIEWSGQYFNRTQRFT